MDIFNNWKDKYKLVIVDFDGVLTNNKVNVSSSGEEFVTCSRSDGLGFSELKKLNIGSIILSTDISPIVLHRAKKMKVKAVNAIDNKLDYVLNNICSASLNMENIIYIGNDLNDLDVMRSVGLKICPKDAWQEIKDISDIILDVAGGEGVVREFARILKIVK